MMPNSLFNTCLHIISGVHTIAILTDIVININIFFLTDMVFKTYPTWQIRASIATDTYVSPHTESIKIIKPPSAQVVALSAAVNHFARIWNTTNSRSSKCEQHGGALWCGNKYRFLGNRSLDGEIINHHFPDERCATCLLPLFKRQVKRLAIREKKVIQLNRSVRCSCIAFTITMLVLYVSISDRMYLRVFRTSWCEI